MSKNVSDKSRKTKLKSRFQCQTNLIVDFKNESYIFCTQRFAAWRSGGFLAQKFNRRTALPPAGRRRPASEKPQGLSWR